MPAIDIPFFGNLIICLVLISAAYTFATALGAARGRPHLLVAARWGTYATCALVFLAVCLLGYAFQTHDFRIRYVARYSDRSMTWYYLVTSLWGGQDGSLLWWSLLLSGYTAACTRWLKGKYIELQPWVLATLMSIFIFFVLLMLFAANPFQTFVAAAPADGEGLNPLLQNYWMMIHPPTLYMGLVGWAVPFGFVIAALATGRLNSEWIHAARLWTMIAWTFLSVGLLLGCLWSYEELGWGGYWAWDPVENAAFMPWLAGTAYLHSAIIQERYGMMRVWNVFLMCLAFIMTIFGTFLTRSGMIASVHSFARSDIGILFVYYLVILVAGCAVLMWWRMPKLNAEHRIVSMVSREVAFLFNNWVLLFMMIFILVATTWPLISEAVRGEEVTVGPAFYNEWMVPFGLVLLFLMGLGPLISWRKATGKKLQKALAFPIGLSLVWLVIHSLFGAGVDFPAYIPPDEIYNTFTGKVLGAFHSIAPVASTSAAAFVLGSISQEFWRGARVRMKSKGENFFTALYQLTMRAKRRYGGYIVHLGIMVMFVGFTGAAYDQETEAALRPGESLTVGDYELRYEEPVTKQDPNKTMIFTKMTVLDKGGDELGTIFPAKFRYRTHPDMPTTEVAIRSRAVEDIYVIMSTVDQTTKRATFRVIIRPLVAWIWIGGLLLLFGAIIGMSPSAKDLLKKEKEKKRSKRSVPAKTAAGALLLCIPMLVYAGDAQAQSDGSSSLHAGSVVMNNAVERQLFPKLLCQCGDCARLPMDGCGCNWAVTHRKEIRERLAANETPNDIMESWRAKFGAKALAVPSDKGMDRALWAVPMTGGLLAAIGLVFMGRRWRNKNTLADKTERDEAQTERDEAPKADQEYDDKLDAELARMEDES